MTVIDPKQFKNIRPIPVKFGEMTFDVAKKEGVNWSWTSTKYKMQSGTSSTDMRVKDPDVITLDIVLIDKHYGVKETLANTLTGEGLAPQTWRDKYQQLKELVNDNDPKTLAIGLDTFESMNVVRVSINRDKTTSGYLPFSVTFEKFHIIDTEFRDVDTSLMPGYGETEEDTNKKEKRKPAKKKSPTKKEPTQQQEESILYSLFGG